MPRVTEEYYEMKKKEIIDAAYRVCLRKPITAMEMKDKMKIKSFFIFCCFSMFLIGCNSKEIDEIKNKNELLEKENNDLNTQISDLSNSLRELKKTNYELNHQHEDSEQYMFSDFEEDLNIKSKGINDFPSDHAKVSILKPLTNLD